MSEAENLFEYQPGLAVKDSAAVDRIRSDESLDWFHKVKLGDFVTPGYDFDFHWSFVASFLSRHKALIDGADVLEPGCADGLWSAWLTRLGAKHIDATDLANRVQFELVAKALDLPVKYYPGVVSCMLPSILKRTYDVVCSLGLLYHVHDPLTTLAMYRRYLPEGGVLILETGAMESDAAYLQYTGASQVYTREGGNQFMFSIGFLKSALDELGMEVIDIDYHTENMKDELGADVGRAIVVARRTGMVKMHNYISLLQQLGMTTPEFPKEHWYGHDI